MRRRLATGDRAVVATGASTDHVAMIYRNGWDRCPGYRSRLMTGITSIGGIDMVCRLTGCQCTVMTTGTDTLHFVVIHCARRYGYPAGREHIMARFANIACRQMRGGLATRRYAIMTTDAVVGKG